jgi:hypothetical protein
MAAGADHQVTAPPGPVANSAGEIDRLRGQIANTRARMGVAIDGIHAHLVPATGVRHVVAASPKLTVGVVAGGVAAAAAFFTRRSHSPRTRAGATRVLKALSAAIEVVAVVNQMRAEIRASGLPESRR